MSDEERARLDRERAAGFYWVKRGAENPAVAEWQVYDLAPHQEVPPRRAWWNFPGESVEDGIRESFVQVLSERLSLSDSYVGGDTIVRWRGSPSDLATDLKAVLSIGEAERLCVELLAQYERELRVGQSAAEKRPVEPKIDNPAAPVPILLHCPECNERHIDRGEFATKVHHTHSCQFCGMTWRPAVVPTVGVQFLPGFGPSAAEGGESRKVKAESSGGSRQQTVGIQPGGDPEPERKSPPVDSRSTCQHVFTGKADCDLCGMGLVSLWFNAQTDCRQLEGRLAKIKKLAVAFEDGQLDSNQVARLCETPSGFWCPKTKTECTRACVGSECLYWPSTPVKRCPKCERAWNAGHADDCPERDMF